MAVIVLRNSIYSQELHSSNITITLLPIHQKSLHFGSFEFITQGHKIPSNKKSWLSSPLIKKNDRWSAALEMMFLAACYYNKKDG